MAKVLMKYGICLNGLLGTHLSLKMLVIFLGILFPTHVHSMLDRIMLLFGDMCNSSDHNISSYPYYACYAHPNSSLPLAQCMGLEVGEPFGLVARFVMNNTCCGLENSI